jgi:predicted nucleotidyltransferase
MQQVIDSFGLPGTVRDSLERLFDSIPEVQEVVIFGSRAKGNYRPGSDINLTIKGQDISLDTILTLMSRVDDLGLLYKIDFQNFATISDEAVLDHIRRAGKLFWKR